MRNILVIDFDGVINNERLEDEYLHFELPDTFHQYNIDLVNNIKTIISHYDFELLISSTWRKDFDIERMQYFVNEIWGWNTKVVGYTSDDFLDRDYRERFEWDPNADHRERGMQITQWMENNKSFMQGRKYVVIDDSHDAKYGHENQFFSVNCTTGFDQEHLESFIKFIGDMK